MKIRDWLLIVALLILSNATTLFVVKTYMTPEIKAIDMVKLVDTQRKTDITKVLDGQMTKEDFLKKSELIGATIDAFANEQAGSGIVVVKQCLVGGHFTDITAGAKDALSK